MFANFTDVFQLIGVAFWQLCGEGENVLLIDTAFCYSTIHWWACVVNVDSGLAICWYGRKTVAGATVGVSVPKAVTYCSTVTRPTLYQTTTDHTLTVNLT